MSFPLSKKKKKALPPPMKSQTVYEMHPLAHLPPANICCVPHLKHSRRYDFSSTSVLISLVISKLILLQLFNVYFYGEMKCCRTCSPGKIGSEPSD